MKRFTAVLLVALVFSLAMSACGGGGGSDSGGNNPPSSTPPTAPVITSAVPGAGGNSATIGWSAVAEATGYNLYYSNQSPVTKSSVRSVAVVSPYTIQNLTAGQRYYFAVTAYNSTGESNLSNEVVVDVPTLPVKFQFTGSAGPFLPLLMDNNALYIGLTRSGDAYLAKFDKTTGRKIWETSVLATTYPDSVTGIAVLGNDVIVFCLEDDYVIPGMGGGKIWFVKLDATSGMKLVDIPEINRGSVVGPVALNGFLYAYISYDGGSRSIAKIDSNGNMVFQILPYDSYTVVKADSTGIYFAGGVSRLAVARYDGDLNRQWYFQYDSGTDPTDADLPGVNALAMSGDAVYVSGFLQLFSGSGQGVTVKVNKAIGTFVWDNKNTPFYDFLLSSGMDIFGVNWHGTTMDSIDVGTGNTLWSQSLGGSMADWKDDSGLIYITQFGTDRVRVFDPVSRQWLN